MLCVAGGFSAYRYKAWAAWEGEREGVVYFAVRTVTWDGVETQDLARTEDSAPFANAFRVLVENGAWSLADARPVYGFGGPPLDLPTYYVTVADRVCRNSFSVFDPLGLDDKRYLVIVQALQSFFSDCGL